MDQPKRPTITIKLKPHLQEYVRSDLKGKIIASKRNVIGKLIKPFLAIRPAGEKPEIHTGSEWFVFEIPRYEDLNVDCNLWIAPAHQKIIEEFLELHFKDLFYHYMKDKVRMSGSFKKSILQFCLDYDFSFQYINYEMLKKDYYRRRKEELLIKASEDEKKPQKKMLSALVPKKALGSHNSVPPEDRECEFVFLIR